MKEYTPFPFKVIEQGASTIEGAWEMASGQDVKAVWLNTKAKDSVFATGTEDGAPLVILSPQSDDNDMTQIAFPSMKGWELWATEASRYTVCLCFVRMEKPVETL